MTERSQDLSAGDFRPTHNDWLRLRTVLGLRWVAISGQLLAVLFAHYVLGIDLPLDYEHQNDRPEGKLSGPVPAAEIA